MAQGVQFANGKLAARDGAAFVAVHRAQSLCKIGEDVYKLFCSLRRLAIDAGEQFLKGRVADLLWRHSNHHGR